jgi:hypothetical protein
MRCAQFEDTLYSELEYQDDDEKQATDFECVPAPVWELLYNDPVGRE